MLKKILLALVILVLVVVVAAVAIVLLVDVNRFKPQIEAAVAEQTGRNLTIDGDLALSFYPRLAIELPRTTLSNADGKGEALRIGGAGVGVAVVPLLSGRLEADVVRLDGLRLEFVRYKDGSTNFDDLIGKSGTQPNADPSSGPGQGGGAPLSEIRVGGLELTNAQIVIDDRQRGDVITVADLNLRAGEIADGVTTPVELSAAVSGKQPALALNLKLEADVRPQLGAGALAVPQLATEVKGTIDGMAIGQTQTYRNLTIDAKAVRAESLALKVDFEQPGQRILHLSLSAPLLLDLAGPRLTLQDFKGSLDVDDKAVAPQPLSLPFSGNLLADAGAETVDASLNVDAPDTRLAATAKVNGFAKPKVRFAIDADKIDVDRYLPPRAEATKPADPTPPSGGSLFAAVDPIPVDLSVLRGLDLAGQIKIGQLKASGLNVSAIRADLGAAGGVFDLKTAEAKLYGGSFDIRGSARADGGRIAATSNLSNVDIAPMLRDLTGDALLEGTANLAFDLKAQGATVGELRRSLGGAMNVRMSDGAIVGINIAEKIREARAKLAGGGAQQGGFDRTQKTDFASLGGSFALRNGVASNDDLTAKSPLFRLAGHGVIDLVKEVLDYTVEASVVATTKGQGGAELAELNGVTIPVALSGGLTTPQWKIDWSSVARQALESRAGEKLKAQLEPAKAEAQARLQAEKEALKAREDELKDKARDKLGEKLKGLLQR
ncbi:MAG: AsmA family protein [Burkholderiaceae bacterium]